MNVIDPIFESLWEATLSELGAEPGIWEVYWDTPNFYAGAPSEIRAAEAAAILQRLHTEGWADFVQRPWSASAAPRDEHLLSASEVAALIISDLWRADPPLPDGRLPDELNVWLRPTTKWSEWWSDCSDRYSAPQGTFLNAGPHRRLLC